MSLRVGLTAMILGIMFSPPGVREYRTRVRSLSIWRQILPDVRSNHSPSMRCGRFGTTRSPVPFRHPPPISYDLRGTPAGDATIADRTELIMNVLACTLNGNDGLRDVAYRTDGHLKVQGSRFKVQGSRFKTSMFHSSGSIPVACDMLLEACGLPLAALIVVSFASYGN